MELIESLLVMIGTPFGLLLTGGAVAVFVLIWDWRVALAGLIFVQMGVAAATVTTAQIPLSKSTHQRPLTVANIRSSGA